MSCRLGIVGGGTMGLAITRGAVAAHVLHAEEVLVVEIDTKKHPAFAELGVAVTADPRAVRDCAQILLAVKPQVLGDVASTIGPLGGPTIIISIMAGIETSLIRQRLGGHARVIRAMPNTPCQLGEGMTGLALGAGAQPGDESLARHIFEALGRTAMLDESLMDAVTAVSGSGPAYVYLLAELMEKAAQKLDLDEPTAQLLVVQTIIGAGRMLREAGMEPEELRRAVTTPNGTTAAAFEVMFKGDLPGILIDALAAARDRGIELSREHG